MKCNECEREVEVEDGVALCHYHYNNESLAKPGAFYEVKAGRLHLQFVAITSYQ
jgi:hypothetical protein